METIIPKKLSKGSGIRIVAPSCSLPTVSWMTDALWNRAKRFYEDRGMTVSEAKHLREVDVFGSTSIEHRIQDLHDGFSDPAIHALHCVRGGWNVNQLLPHLDYNLIAKNPKILCGFSDITALGNAIYAKTGIVTYSGPNFNQFAFGEKMEYTYDHYEKAVLRNDPIELCPSPKWTDDYYTEGSPWELRHKGEWWVLEEGRAEGVSIGGNLCTLNLLQGTEYMPEEQNSILFIEDDHETHPRMFDRDLTSLTQQPWFRGVRGILLGRCQTMATNQEFGPVTKDLLLSIIDNNPNLQGMPIIANVDFGHTYPTFTFPIGGEVEVEAVKGKAKIRILKH